MPYCIELSNESSVSGLYIFYVTSSFYFSEWSGLLKPVLNPMSKG